MFSKTLEEHVEQLQAVFARPCQHNLKLKPSKCELLKTKVSYLGHVISEAGISTDPEKTSAVEQWPVLKNILVFCQILLSFYQELRQTGGASEWFASRAWIYCNNKVQEEEEAIS